MAGGVMKVIVISGQGSSEHMVSRSATVGQAFEAAGVTVDDYSMVRLNGKPAGENSKLKTGSTVSILSPASGGIL
jgi:molybdopterin converting factor small subunit